MFNLILFNHNLCLMLSRSVAELSWLKIDLTWVERGVKNLPPKRQEQSPEKGLINIGLMMLRGWLVLGRDWLRSNVVRVSILVKKYNQPEVSGVRSYLLYSTKWS